MSEQIQDRLSCLEPEPTFPPTASEVFSLGNLGNLSRDRFDPPPMDSAVTFLRSLAPDQREEAALLAASESVLPPPALLLKDPPRLRVLPVVIALVAAALGFGATLLAVGLPGRMSPPAPPSPSPSPSSSVTTSRPPPHLADPLPVPSPSAVAAEAEPPAGPPPAVLDRTQLGRAMDRLRFRVRRCFARAHRRGRARVQVTVLASGEPSAVRVSSRAGRPVVTCIRRKVRQTWFPPIGSPSMSIARTYASR